MNNTMTTIEIAMAADADYSFGLFATATSIARSASKNAKLSYTILDGGLSSDFLNKLEKTLSLIHDSVRVNVFKINQDDFKDFPDWRGNKMAYARFLLPALLPRVSHVIYCDVDFLWLRDISILWNMRSDKDILLACHDPLVSKTSEKEWFAAHGYKYVEEKYFCTGLLVMNLDLFRRNNVVQKVYTLLAKDKFMFPDQGAMNVVLGEKVCIISNDWMTFTSCLTRSTCLNNLVLHYVNDVPWTRVHWSAAISDARMIWYRSVSLACSRSLWFVLSIVYGRFYALWLMLLSLILRLWPINWLLIKMLYKCNRGHLARYIYDSIKPQWFRLMPKKEL